MLGGPRFTAQMLGFFIHSRHEKHTHFIYIIVPPLCTDARQLTSSGEKKTTAIALCTAEGAKLREDLDE